MANRESLMNALIELECKPTTYSRELLRKNWVEALNTAEFDPCDRLDGRTARKELSLYDAMMAEIYAEKERRLRKFERTHHADNSKKDETKVDRKRNKQNRMHRLYGLAYEDTKYGKTVYFWDKKEGQKKFPEYEAEIFRNLKERSAEKVDLADWELESSEIAEDEMIARFNAELEEFDRKWREQAEAEQRRMREYRKLRDLHEWLKYA